MSQTQLTDALNNLFCFTRAEGKMSCDDIVMTFWTGGEWIKEQSIRFIIILILLSIRFRLIRLLLRFPYTAKNTT